MPGSRWNPVVIACAGIVSCAGAALWAHAAMPAFDARAMPLAMAGTPGVPGATLFNLFAFIVPGVCALACAWRWRRAVNALPVAARLGAWMAMLAGLAFIAQGAWPLAGDVLRGDARVHAAAWMAWWIAAGCAAVATAAGMASRAPGIALASGAAAVAIVALAWNLPAWPPGIAQRASLLAWGAWVLVLASSDPRTRTSTPG